MSAHHSSSTPATSTPKVQGPYVALPNGLLLAEGLPAAAKVIAGQLATLGWRTGYVTQTIPYLARCCRVATRTLEKWIGVLKTWGLVRSVSDQDAPSGRRLYLTWLADPYAKSDAEPIEDRMNVQGHTRAGLIGTRDREVTENQEKKEADLRPRPEAETPATPPVVEEIAQEAAQEAQEARPEPVDVPSVQDEP